ncbi:hypothetical protein MNBD_ALPHA08-434 [hydrothermal vent metagenome]|uniref:Cytochrome c n=1 Tax=hydrothermal vent metagenome TaxID=652676 RepID=A0A3B0RCX2_9ZZZZ
MKKFVRFGFVSAAILAVQLAPVPMAYAGPIEDRQAAMKAVSESTKALAAVVRGERPFFAELVERHGDRILNSFIKAQKLFNNGVETKGSTAKATIWSKPDGFARIFAGGIAGAKAAAAAGANSDPAALKAAFGQLAQSCKSCHEGYRLPKGW